MWARDAKPVRFLYQIRVRLIKTSTTNVHYTNEKHKNTNVIMQKNMNFGLVLTSTLCTMYWAYTNPVILLTLNFKSMVWSINQHKTVRSTVSSERATLLIFRWLLLLSNTCYLLFFFSNTVWNKYLTSFIIMCFNYYARLAIFDGSCVLYLCHFCT